MSCDGDDNLLTQDIISVLIKKWENHKQNPFHPNTKPEYFSETYLFFDLDLHNQNSKNSLSTGHKLDQVRTLVNFFNDETGNGKMYISYPMIESVRYTKELPDNCFHTYTYPAFSTNFKQDAAAFSAYPNLDFISFRFSTKGNKQKGWEIEVPKLIKNWMNISKQHILKANWLCNRQLSIPASYNSVQQNSVFNAERELITQKEEISILNAFPLFLFDYFGKKLFIHPHEAKS